jgi:outer membrane protein OmpA-like peptidoglycan-associated protein
MKKYRMAPAMLIVSTLIAGCSSMPTTTSLLDTARRDYLTAQNNPAVVSMAALELKQAGEALDQANNASSKRAAKEDIDHWAYIAKQRTAVAQEVAKQKTAELAIANATKERDQIRLQQRTLELNKARQAEAEALNKAQLAELRARQVEAQLTDLAAKKTERGLVVTLGDVLFSSGSTQPKSGGIRSVQKVGEILKENPQRVVAIEGFTDNTGNANRNQILSEQRANAVRDLLLQMGISSDRITARGYGQEFPIADNNTATGRQLNRRVEIIISDNSGKITPR